MKTSNIVSWLVLGLALVLSSLVGAPLENGRHKPRVLVIGHASALPDVVSLRAENPDFVWQTESVAGNLLANQGQDIRQRTFYWIDFERSAEVVEQSILAALKRHPQAIVLTMRPGWKFYPESVRKEIMRQVQAGAVLSVFGVGDVFRGDFGTLWKSERLTVDFETVQPKDVFQMECFAYGSGRVLIQPGYLDHRYGFVAPQMKSVAEHRYWLARYGQWLRVALKRSSGKIAEIRSSWYNEGGQEVQDVAQQPAGRFFQIRRSYDESGSLVATAGKCVRRDSVVGIAKLKRVSPLMRKTGEELTVRITWKRKEKGGVTRLALKDAHGRIYGEKLSRGTPQLMTVNIPGTSTSVYNMAEVSYVLDNYPQERAEVCFTLPEKRRREPFYFLAWNTFIADTVRHRNYFRLLKEQGIDGFTHMGPWESVMRILAEQDLLFVPYTAAFHWSTIPMLMDEKRQAETLEKVKKAALRGRQYGILAHSLGDENYVSAFAKKGMLWDDPVFWSGFQAFLKTRYGTLEALNKQWNRSYKDWKDIRFKDDRDIFSYDRPSAWVDCRRFVSSLFIQRQVVLSKAIREIDPQAYVGWDGGEQYSSYDGYDLYPYVSSFTMSNVYARSFMDKMLPNKIFNGHCMRSFAPAGALLGLWMNGVAYPSELYLTPYVALFSGIRSIWWWHALFAEEEVTPLRSDLTPGIPFRETARAVREIKAGPAALLANSQPEAPQIAIYYSAANFHASSLSAVLGNHVNNLGASQVQWGRCPAERMWKKYKEMGADWGKGKPVGHFAPAFKSFITLVKDLNLDAFAIDRRQIENGELNRYRLLILPFTESLSDREAEEIRKFVNEGGCVIGDYRTGVRDGSCTFRQQGVLDDVFGIVQKAPFAVCRQPQTMQVDSYMGDGMMSFRLPVTFTQSIETRQGVQKLGATDSGTPAFIVNGFGKGHAVFLNCDFYQYFDLRRERREFSIREYWRSFMIRYLNMPRWLVVKSAGQVPLAATSVFRFQDGEAHYVGVIPDRQLDEEPVMLPALVPMNAEGYLYDVLAGKYLGFGRTASIQLTRGKPALLAVMPEKVMVPKIIGPDKLTCGELGSFTVKPGVGAHTLRLRVFAPDGTEQKHYGHFIHVTSGQADYVLPTALNDVTGTWRLEATELASGLTGIHTWNLNVR